MECDLPRDRRGHNPIFRMIHMAQPSLPTAVAKGEEDEEEEGCCRGGDRQAPGGLFHGEAFWIPPALGGICWGWWELAPGCPG